MRAIQVFIAAVLQDSGGELQHCIHVCNWEGQAAFQPIRHIQLQICPGMEALLEVVIKVVEQGYPVVKVTLHKHIETSSFGLEGEERYQMRSEGADLGKGVLEPSKKLSKFFEGRRQGFIRESLDLWWLQGSRAVIGGCWTSTRSVRLTETAYHFQRLLHFHFHIIAGLPCTIKHSHLARCPHKRPSCSEAEAAFECVLGMVYSRDPSLGPARERSNDQPVRPETYPGRLVILVTRIDYSADSGLSPVCQMHACMHFTRGKSQS